MDGPQDARAAAPLLRPDGLVAERPAETGHRRDNAEQGLPPQQGVATRARASAYRVRLDLATGVLVLSEEQGGGGHGRGWHAAIESVDQDMPRALFSFRDDGCPWTNPLPSPARPRRSPHHR